MIDKKSKQILLYYNDFYIYYVIFISSELARLMIMHFLLSARSFCDDTDDAPVVREA